MELTAEGRTLPDAFSRIALDLFAAAVDPASVDEAEVREVRAHGAGVPALLRRWLEECLYVYEVEGFTSRSIEFVVFDEAPTVGGEPLRLHAFLRGEPVDPARHRVQGLVRGIAGDGLAVEPLPRGFRVRAKLEL
ncbi:MAG TPA: archease [Candidatus Deferrimicrobiaceae bacterium]|nr:archease [Candidatus Deferrimicrobiaceae bacterium]